MEDAIRKIAAALVEPVEPVLFTLGRGLERRRPKADAEERAKRELSKLKANLGD